MRINVRRLETGGFSKEKSLDFACDLDFSHVHQWGEHPFHEPVHVKGEVSVDLGIMTLSYTASFIREDHCARCLIPTQAPYNLAFSHTVMERDPDDEPDDDTASSVDGMIELDELVLGDILLTQNGVALCKPDCMGLCGSCGANLNETICACNAEDEPAIDLAPTPFAALLDFMEDSNE